MTIERIMKDIERVDDQIAILEARKRDLEGQKTRAEDAATLKVVKRLKISPAKLQMLNKLSEAEINEMLRQKEEEKKQHEAQKNEG